MKIGTAQLAPLHIIAWRIIWFMPVQIARILFCLLIGISYGPRSAGYAWLETK